jgi:hypothetical protein
VTIGFGWFETEFDCLQVPFGTGRRQRVAEFGAGWTTLIGSAKSKTEASRSILSGEVLK